MTWEDVHTTKRRNVHISNVARMSTICFDYEIGRLFSKTPCYAIFYNTGSIFLDQIKDI